MAEQFTFSAAYGYRIDFAGRSVVLSGDTRVSPDLIEAAVGTQLLVHEVLQASDALLKDNPAMARVKTFHVDASEAGKQAGRERFRRYRSAGCEPVTHNVGAAP
jgi:ribonuclease BN (tRNA processing enzyme)